MQGDYGDACLDKTSEAVQKSDFCKCLWNYKERYEMEASQNLYRLAAYLVSSVDETGYAQASACEVVEWQRVVVVVAAAAFFQRGCRHSCLASAPSFKAEISNPFPPFPLSL